MVICNSCSNIKASYYCYECDEKLCITCKDLHCANKIWVNHKVEFFNLNYLNLIHNEKIYTLSNANNFTEKMKNKDNYYEDGHKFLKELQNYNDNRNKKEIKSENL